MIDTIRVNLKLSNQEEPPGGRCAPNFFIRSGIELRPVWYIFVSTAFHTHRYSTNSFSGQRSIKLRIITSFSPDNGLAERIFTDNPEQLLLCNIQQFFVFQEFAAQSSSLSS